MSTLQITKGKIIRVECGDYLFERSCDAPGRVDVTRLRGNCYTDKNFTLPGNKEEARKFVDGYLRAVEEEIKYASTQLQESTASFAANYNNGEEP